MLYLVLSRDSLWSQLTSENVNNNKIKKFYSDLIKAKFDISKVTQWNTNLKINLFCGSI